MFRMQIVIQKNCIVRIRAQELLGLFYIVGHINEIAFETPGKPFVPSIVVIQKEHTYGVALNICSAKA